MKLPIISGIDVIKSLKKAGFIATRQKWSHIRLEKLMEKRLLRLLSPCILKLRKEHLIG